MGTQLFNNDRSYRPDEIAKKWDVNVRTVYRMVKDIDDPLPAFRPNGKKGVIRVKGSVLNEWTEQNKVNPLEE